MADSEDMKFNKAWHFIVQWGREMENEGREHSNQVVQQFEREMRRVWTIVWGKAEIWDI